MKKKYSLKSTGFFVLIALVVLVGFGLLSQNSNYFKGSLSSLTEPEYIDAGIILEVANCTTNCANPSLITNSRMGLKNMEILIKSVFDGSVVYAEYLNDIPKDSRYEVAFNSSLCGVYSFDAITTRYNLDGATECELGAYDFLVSGVVDTPAQNNLFTEYATFVLTE